MSDEADATWESQDVTHASVNIPRSLASLDRTHYLVVCEGTERGRRIEIGSKAITIGRSSENDLQLKDKKVSSVHCRVSLAAGNILITDLGSTNGTFIENARVESSMLLPAESTLVIGNHVLRHEFRSRKEIEQSEALSEDLQKACRYVQSLLPPPEHHRALTTEWCFIPSIALGGDAFGYHWLDKHRFVIYLIDVCGHGTGPAMHSVSAINTIRQKALPDTDWGDPGAVLCGLNRTYQMDAHGGMYFTIWYGVYHTESRQLRYASAGHPPALLLEADRKALHELQTVDVGIGLFPGREYVGAETTVPEGSTLYVFSDGVYEVQIPGEGMGTYESFKELVTLDAQDGLGESLRIQRAVFERAQAEAVDDDFSLLTVTFT